MTEPTDEELCEAYQNGNLSACEQLLDRYKGLVLYHARSLFLIGGDNQDLIQEGMIGLFRAIGDYDPSAGASFHTFASLCIRRQQWKAVEASNKKKNQPLNEAVSLEDVEITDHMSPEQQLLDEEQGDVLYQEILSLLSPMEQEVLNRYLVQPDYKKIAKDMGAEPKKIDNALQRIRNKIKKYLKV